MRKLKLILACMLMTFFGIGQMWGDSYTITLKSGTGTSDSSSGMTSTTVADYVADGASYVSAVAPSGKVYLAKSECGIKFGNSSGGGSLTFTLATAVKPTSIVVNASQFGASEGTGIFQGQNFDMTGGGGKYSFNNYTVEYDGNTEVTTISVGAEKRGYVKSITVNYGGTTPLTPTCATPTFAPASGEIFSDDIDVEIACSTDDATIYYTTNGNDPTTSSNVYSTALNFTETTTLKALAVKDGLNNSAIATATYTKMATVSGYEIDFESELIAYVDWNFTNFSKDNSITTHGGSYFAKTNGTNTASVTTKAKVANPGTLTYYISKIGTNTNANSKWKARVSEDGTNWTIVGTEYAAGAGVTAGTWNECTADLSSYSNVYVQVYYDGTSAVRTIDDIELTMASATPKAAKPTFETGDDFVTSTSVTLACATEGAKIYYTTNGDEPTSGSTLYEAAIPVSATTTIKAIAVADGYDNSAVAEKTFTKVEALESMAALLEATTSTETAFNVVISNWVVTGVNGNRAWIADAANEKGILLYKSGHGFTAGKKLNGVVIGTKTKLFQGYPELTTLLASEVTVTDAEAVTPRTTTIAALTSGYNAEQGTVVKLENLTYTVASTSFSDGVNTIQADNKLYSASLVDGATYNLTGVVEYENNSVVKIMPRSVDDVEQISGGGLPEVTGLAALKAEATGASYLVTLTDAIVTLVDGSNAFIEDATAGALIYKSGHGFSAGDKLNGQYEVTTATFQGKFEITAIAATTGTKTTDAEIPVTTLTIAQLNANFAANESKRIKIVSVNVTDAVESGDATARTGEISDGANTITLYAGKSGVTAAENANIDVVGYPTFHNTDQQLAVWAQADITVNEKDPAGIAFTPESVTITAGDAWTKPSFANPNGLTVTFNSDNTAVASVSNEGVVALEGGYGTAVITAHTNGDATHSAGNATYTITVNDPSVAPVYTMSFDLTRASYDDAADAEVVWNSNVVTITAQQSTGTKVTNYLAGNYTGTTLIAETRLYENNNLIFTPKSGITITKVEWKATTKAYAESLAKEGTTTAWTNATAVIDGTDDKKVIITPSAAGEFSAVLGKSGSNKGTRGASVVVYYEAESEKSKLAASIAIANINTAVGEDDILLSDIAATSNPNKKAISYAVTSGSEYVSITGEGPDAAFHALAEGTATITATIPNDLGNYTGATETFDIIVAAAPATLVSIAISGTATELEYTDGQHFNPAGLVVTGTYSDASAAPITEGIDWTFDPDPLTEGTTSVSVTATVGSISSEAFAVNGLTVGAAAAPTSGNVVILAEYNSKFYAMSNSLTSGALAGVEVEKDGSNIVVASQTIKEAIQWTATVDGDNTTFQDGEGKYLVHNGTGTNLDLTDAAENWTFNSENGCYSSVSGRAFFYYSTNGVFKNYSISNNLGKTGYSGAPEVIEIDPANIVISSKANPELAYSPASDEITVGDAWSAPELTYASGFDGLAAVTYASNNEAVATVSDAGVIALAGGTGTAVITASFAGNANYLLGSATYTIKVNEVPDNCDATDDFSTANSSSPTSYTTRTTTAGWGATNAGYKVINDASYLMINGKTTAVGVITSPVLSDGIASLKFRYANTNNESNGVSVRIDIKQGTEVVKTYTLTKANSEVTKDVVYTEIIENINVAGEFQIIFTNLSPSNNTGNADRVSIGRLCWSNYSATPTPVETWTEGVRTGLTAGWYYTMCLNKAVTNVRGASIWRVLSMAANGKDVILEDVAGTLDAGRPYIFYATAASLDVVYTGDAVDNPITTGNNGLIGSFSQELITQSATNYIIYNNELYFVNSTAYVGANRAYLDMTAVPGYTSSSPAPGRQRVVMKAHGAQVATGMDEINASETPVKMMINGELFILRGEKMYDATGRLVK